jgi:4-hydroxymandelate oxidase
MRYDELLVAADKFMKEKNLYEAFTYYGSETGYTRKVNSEFFKTIALKLRTIDTKAADTRTTLFGVELATPIIAGAMSHPRVSGLENPLRPWALGMKEAGSMMGVGIVSSQEFSEIMKTGTPTYRICKPFRDRKKIAVEIEEAETLGAVAVGIDIDFVQGGKMAERTFADTQMSPLASEELADLRKETKLPFIIKGVLHEHDAEKCMRIGADAIVVSNHRAMVLDHCVHCLEVLPMIRRIAGPETTILADGGFMRGTDVLKALALGADGVLVGQAILLGVFADGQTGVRDMVQEMTAQLQRAMTLTGCPVIKKIDETILLKRNFII